MLNYAELKPGTIIGDDWTVVSTSGHARNGMRTYKFRHTCGSTIVTTATSIRAGRKCYLCECGNKKFHRATKCWDCANALCGCSWSKNFTPVEGWVAEPTDIILTVQGSKKLTTRSYHVISCPEFVPDPPREVTPCW